MVRKKSEEELEKKAAEPEAFDHAINKIFDEARADASVEELKKQVRRKILDTASQYPRAAYVEERIDEYVSQVFEGVNGRELDTDSLKTQALALVKADFPRIYKRC